jgi:phosphoenolpyruvate carboxykinase (ATP)
MSAAVVSISTKNLLESRIKNTETIHYQIPCLIEFNTRYIAHRRKVCFNETMRLGNQTGEYTGRCPKDKFIVKDEITADRV